MFITETWYSNFLQMFFNLIERRRYYRKLAHYRLFYSFFSFCIHPAVDSKDKNCRQNNCQTGEELYIILFGSDPVMIEFDD